VAVLAIHGSYQADALAAGTGAFLVKGRATADRLRAILHYWQEVRDE
jgi:hypothetical protein